jgi:hypothetical protein
LEKIKTERKKRDFGVKDEEKRFFSITFAVLIYFTAHETPPEMEEKFREVDTKETSRLKVH